MCWQHEFRWAGRSASSSSWCSKCNTPPESMGPAAGIVTMRGMARFGMAQFAPNCFWLELWQPDRNVARHPAKGHPAPSHHITAGRAKLFLARSKHSSTMSLKRMMCRGLRDLAKLSAAEHCLWAITATTGQGLQVKGLQVKGLQVRGYTSGATGQGATSQGVQVKGLQVSGT